MVYIFAPTCLNSFVTRPKSEPQYVTAGLSHALDFVFLLPVKGKGKVFPLQARCGPEGG